MTVLAFDGKTLAADRQAESGGHTTTMRKILRCQDGSLVGIAGHAAHGMRLLRWAVEGFDPAAFPVHKDDNDCAHLYRVMPDGKILVYENTIEPLRLLDSMFAGGCGRGLALGAMAAGADAKRAVEIACEHHAGCGRGVDVLALEPETTK